MPEDTFPTPAESAPSHGNLLEHSASSYLRSARHQPVKWHPWGDAAFARAQAEDKPILLDIGAVWCHWCHVMDRESYENPEIAAHHQRAFCGRESRPRRAARRRCALPGRRLGHQRTGRLAADGLSHSRWASLFWRYLYSARRPLWAAGIWTRAAQPSPRCGGNAATRRLKRLQASWPLSSTTRSFSGRGGELTLALVDKIAGSILAQFDSRTAASARSPSFPIPQLSTCCCRWRMNRANRARHAMLSL